MSDQQGHSDQQQPTLEQQKWLEELNRHDAQRAHDLTSEIAQFADKAAIEYANLALRTAVLINGGAAVSVLAFVGGLVAQGRVATDFALREISSALIWFAFGVSAATLAMASSYLTNYCSASQLARQQRIWKHPYVVATATSKRWRCASMFFQILALVLGFGSIGLFARGMFAVKDSFGHLVH